MIFAEDYSMNLYFVTFFYLFCFLSPHAIFFMQLDYILNSSIKWELKIHNLFYVAFYQFYFIQSFDCNNGEIFFLIFQRRGTSCLVFHQRIGSIGGEEIETKDSKPVVKSVSSAICRKWVFTLILFIYIKSKDPFRNPLLHC